MSNRIDLQERWLPVQAFFNASWDNSIVRTLDVLSKGISCTIDDVRCQFPTELDFDDEPFEGVKFSLFDEYVTLTNEEFRQVFEQVCRNQKLRRPEQSEEIDRILDQLQI